MVEHFRPFKAVHGKSHKKIQRQPLTPLQQAQMEYANKKKKQDEDLEIKEEFSGNAKKIHLERKIRGTKKHFSFPKLKLISKKKKNISPVRVFHEEKKQGKRTHAILYTFFISGFLATGYLLSPYGHVDKVQVTGDTEIPEQLIIDASHITAKKTMVGTVSSQSGIIKEIKKELPQIKNAEIEWQGVNTITITVTDFQTIAYIENDLNYQSVLENGNVLTNEEMIPRGSKAILKGFKSGPYLDKLVSELSKVSEEIQNSISDITYKGKETNPYSIVLFMNDGNQVKANLQDFSSKIMYYPDILNQIGEQKGIVDMEVGIFFQPFEETGDGKKESQPLDLESAE